MILCKVVDLDGSIERVLTQQFKNHFRRAMVSTRLMFFMCRDHDRGCQSGFLLYPVDGADFGDSNLV